ncbi:NAD-dependent epimerase/dehydratase family protein [Patescibacteria group bacterium]|nr:NAD-dependent epimerase/dehydratase family protein [Patescibacteria group bacterium]
MPNPKTILVTGCAGFIGGHFVQQFKKRFPKTKIVGIDDLSTGRKDMLDSSTIFYKGSILDEKLIKNIFSKHKIEYVFHFAAVARVFDTIERPRYTSEVNIIGTVALLEASKNHRVKRFIYSSSSLVYGNDTKLPMKESENVFDPKYPYSIQKYVGEPFCKIFSELFGLETVCLRYFTVFGPKQYGDSPYSTVICAWLESLYFPKNKKAFITGDGNQSRDFCHVNNVVWANILAMESKKHFQGEVFNVGSGIRIKLNDVKRLIAKYTGKRLQPEKRPPRVGDVRHTCADITKARRVLGYKPIVNFDEGLKQTIRWFESRKI